MDEDTLSREREFHNERYAGGVDNRHSQDKYYFALDGMKREYESLIKTLSDGKCILDYGCGVGEFTFLVTDSAKVVYGIDISEEAVEGAQSIARERGLDHVHFSVGDAHALAFPDGMFDVVFGAGIIHHLNTEVAFKEIHRVLKPGGVAIFQEPLAGNFAIRAYRAFTPSARSVDEHPLKRADFKIADNIFSAVNFQFYGLTSLLSVPFRTRPGGAYLLKMLGGIDRLLVQMPGVRWQAWYSLMLMTK